MIHLFNIPKIKWLAWGVGVPHEQFEFQERVRKLVVRIVKHYRGKGPENVKVKIENERQISIEIRGILSNLSEILVKEGASEIVKEYWKVLKPYLEKEFLEEVNETIGSPFTYEWELCSLSQNDRSIIIKVNKQV